MSSKGRLARVMRLFMIALTVTSAPMALAQTSSEKSPRLKTYGKYSQKTAKKAQANVRAAMVTPMVDLLRKAAELNPEAMLNYGLALELGRPSATKDMNERERAQVQQVFQTLLILYVRATDRVDLTGKESVLLDQPDFWILMARSMSFVPPPVYATVTESGGGDLSSVTESQLMMTSIDGKRYSLKGEPMLNGQIVSAAQSCAIYARVGARMEKVMRLDPASTPHLTVQALDDYKKQAKVVYKQARGFGIDGCAGENNYKAALAFASLHLGKLGTLADGTDALITDEEVETEPLKP